MVNITESNYASYLTYNGNIANFEFTYADGSIIPSWIESNQSGKLIIWLKMSSIPAQSTVTIYLHFAPKTTNLLSNSGTTGIGEAPQLSSTYGQYDDGASVFNNYWNFAGTTLSSKWTVPTGGLYTVNNGFIGEPGAVTAIYSATTPETNTIITEWALNLSSTTYGTHQFYFQLNRYTSTSNINFLYIQGLDYIVNGGTRFATENIGSSGVHIFGIWNNGATVWWYYDLGILYQGSGLTAVTDYVSLGWAYFGQTYNFPTTYYVRTRAYPPNGVMPSYTFSSIG